MTVAFCTQSICTKRHETACLAQLSTEIFYNTKTGLGLFLPPNAIRGFFVNFIINENDDDDC